MKKRRFFLFSLFALLLMVGIPSGYLLRGYRHDQVNRELIFAIKADKTNKALDALEVQADPNFRDPGDEAPSFRHYLSVLWQQMRGIKPPTPRIGLTALGVAVKQNNTVLVEALLADGARNSRETVQTQNEDHDVNGFTPLISAAGLGKLKTVRLLIDRGADVNASNDWMTLLLARGAAIDATGSDGRTALMLAISGQDDDIVRLLLAKRANINLRANNGETALSIAERKLPNFVPALKKAGAIE